MKVVCIVPSAGKGKRFGSRESKPFVMLNKKPILAHTLRAIAQCRFIGSIVVAVARDKVGACGRLVKKYKCPKVDYIVAGGAKRFDSVKNALAKAKDADYIIVHDGARPIVSDGLMRRVLAAAKNFGAAIPAMPAKQTIKIMDNKSFVSKTPQRKILWEVQTPQAFKRELIIKAYQKVKDRNATDDSSLVERLRNKVKIVKGEYSNIKITTPEDLALAGLLIRKHRRGC